MVFGHYIPPSPAKKNTKQKQEEGTKQKNLINLSSPPSLPPCLLSSIYRPQRNTAEPQITVGCNSYLIMTSVS